MRMKGLNRLRHEPKVGIALCVAGVVTAVILCAPVAFAETLRGRIHKGNALYQQGLYDKALETYEDAQIDAPESPELLFNIGNVKYREEEHESAIETYQKSFTTDDILLEAKAYYNTGNAKYRLGEKTGNIGLWREAIEYYKRAIELDPDDEDAKYNLEFVERKIKDALSKQQEEQQKQEQQQQQPQKQEEQSDQAEGEQQQEQPRQDRQEQEEEREQEREEQMQTAIETPQEIEPEQVSVQGEQEETENLPAQEIFSILQSEEEAARDQARAVAMPYQRRVLKDW
jgi:Ca-activated chloride channel family protein